MHLFINYLWEDPQLFFMWLLIVVFAICCHEYMHARIALWQGDSTAADQGHLTLNPLRQMGLMSLIMLAVVGLAWGQVPVNPSRMRHKYSDALVSFAGPATNFVLGIIFCFVVALIVIIFGGQDPASTGGEISNNAIRFFQMGAMLNFVLFTLNMIPVPPFDGWHIASSFFPKLKTSNSQTLSFVALVILLLIFKYGHYLFFVGRLMSELIIFGIMFLARMLGA